MDLNLNTVPVLSELQACYFSAVTVHGESASFEGFLLQARVVGDASDSPVGTFTSPPSDTELRRCQAEGDTLIHSDETNQQEVTVTWNAPNKRVGDVEFM